jgi:hypothetical protein
MCHCHQDVQYERVATSVTGMIDIMGRWNAAWRHLPVTILVICMPSLGNRGALSL